MAKESKYICLQKLENNQEKRQAQINESCKI